MIKNFLLKEKKYFLLLSADVRKLLLSYYLYLVAYPLFAVFINAYLWRQGEDLISLIIYNLFYCFGLPIGFYSNGLLLRRFHTLRLYALGGILEGLAAVLVVVFPLEISGSLILYGLLAGFGAGLYWSNKNYLSLRLTRGTNRLYYNTLESAGDMIINMIVPALAGIFIAAGSRWGWYLPDTAYKWLMLVALAIVALAGWIVQSSKIKDLENEPMFLPRASSRWGLVRLYNVLANLVVGAEFIIPGVLVLTLVGKEGTLGIITSATAILSAVCLYLLGRLGRLESTWKVIAVAGLIYLFGASLLAFSFSPISVLVYMAVSTIGWAFRWPPSYAVIMETMDREAPKNQYAYICDNELTFNLGRSLGILLIFALQTIDQNIALRFVPLIVGLVSLVAIFPLIRLTKLIK